MPTARLVGFDIPSMINAAGAKPTGQQKAEYNRLVSAGLGTSPVFIIQVAGQGVYQAGITGALQYDATGVTVPSQFAEPPALNNAAALSGTDALVVIRNGSNSSVYVEVPVRVGGGADYLTGSKALNGTDLVRTQGFKLLAPATLDVTGGDTGGTALYSKTELTADMTLANENGWGIAQAPNTHRGSTVYAQITVAIKRSDGDSGYPDVYISDNSIPTPYGYNVTATDSSSVNLLGWIVAGRASGSGSARSINSRLQLRKFKLIAYLRNGTYQELATDDFGIIGASWHADFAYPGKEFYLDIETGAALYQARVESAANGGGESLGSIGSGNWGTVWNPNRSVNLTRFEDFTLHAYPIGYTNTRKWWVDNVRAVVQSCEARLIVHDSTKADDRSSANIMIWSGADWRVGGTYITDGAGVGRVKLVPGNGDWRVFTWSSVPTSIMNTNPPTGWS